LFNLIITLWLMEERTEEDDDTVNRDILDTVCIINYVIIIISVITAVGRAQENMY